MNVPIVAETLFSIGRMPITNAYVNSTIAMLLFVALAVALRSRISLIPGKLQNAFEAFLEFLMEYFDQVTQDRAKTKKFLPIVGTLFLFILVSNWMGLIPGAGSIGMWEVVEGHRELVPLMRSANSDLNLTLALAIFSVVMSHVLGFMAVGVFTHINKFIQVGSIWKAIKTLSPLKILISLVEAVVGVIETFSELAKVVSLSLRLFGNIFAGEVLLSVISSLISAFAPLPFMALELIVGVIQATVFSMLTLVYLTVATSAPHGDDEEHAHNEKAHASAHAG